MVKITSIVAVVASLLICCASYRMTKMIEGSVVKCNVISRDTLFLEEISRFSFILDSLVAVVAANRKDFKTVASLDTSTRCSHAVNIYIDTLLVVPISNQYDQFARIQSVNGNLRRADSVRFSNYRSNPVGQRIAESIAGTVLMNLVGLPFGVGGYFISGDNRYPEPMSDANFVMNTYSPQCKIESRIEINEMETGKVVFSDTICISNNLLQPVSSSDQVKLCLIQLIPKLIDAKFPYLLLKE